MENIGYGTAFNIRVEPLPLYLASLREWYTLEFLLHEPYLEHNRIKRLSLIGRKKGQAVESFEMLLLAVIKEDREAAIITFTDARGKKYYCKVRIERDRTTLVELPKSLTIGKRSWFYLMSILDKSTTEGKGRIQRFFHLGIFASR